MISGFFYLKFYVFVSFCLLTAEVSQRIVRAKMDEHLMYAVLADEKLLVKSTGKRHWDFKENK